MAASNLNRLQNREIRAVYDFDTITVYQAYGHFIADAALRAQTFVSPFSMSRMTWIKPSFFWMAYRSGWATKTGQERVLAIKIRRSGFDWALRNSSLSHSSAQSHHAKFERPVRVQWDPERNLKLERQNQRSIQIGLSDDAVKKYVEEWIVEIKDVTPLVHEIGQLVSAGEIEKCASLIPMEAVYPLSPDIAEIIEATEQKLDA